MNIGRVAPKINFVHSLTFNGDPGNLASGVPDNIVRTVTENCRTLKFDAAEFE